jgi:hypothetical protein
MALFLVWPEGELLIVAEAQSDSSQNKQALSPAITAAVTGLATD